MAVSAFSPPDSRWIDVLRLPGRLRDDLHAGVEDLLAGQHELRLPAAEEHREEPGEVLVDRVERLLQELSGFAIDLANGVLERRHRFREIGRLGVQILLALPGDLELVERREIDGAEAGDRALQPLDFGRQPGLVAERLQLGGQCGEVGVRFGELARRTVPRRAPSPAL